MVIKIYNEVEKDKNIWIYDFVCEEYVSYPTIIDTGHP